MNLYVWEDFSPAYYNDIAFAIASSPDEARRLILKSGNCKPKYLKGDPEVFPLDKPLSFFVLGGD